MVERLLMSCVAFSLLLTTLGLVPYVLSETQAAKRAVTIADAIEMTRLADPRYNFGGSAKNLVAKFSPDKGKFVVALRKGNLKENTNEYSLMLWRTADIYLNPAPEILLTLSSSSNREAIKNVIWLDNDTVAFLGEGQGQLQQVHTFDLDTRILNTLTESTTNVVSYTTALGGRRIVFAAEEPPESVLTQKVRKEGIRLSGTESLPSLIAGYRTHTGRPGLFLRKEDKSCIPIRTKGPLSRYLSGEPVLSPDGRYFVVRTQTIDPPQSWKEYTEPFLQHIMQEVLPKGEPSRVEKYELIDTVSGEAQVLLDAPIGTYGSEAAWSPDSRSVVLAGVYLPLDTTGDQERSARQSSTFAVEVKIPDKEIVTIAQGDLKLVGWDPTTNYLAFAGNRLSGAPGPTVFYRKKGANWGLVTHTSVKPVPIDVVLEEDLNTPPRIVAVDPEHHLRALLLDLNPKFEELNFAKVETLTWKATDEHEVTGGLYLPLDYVRGRRYPLVIQTHGFTSEKFWIDGPFTTAFAAQPLAAKGFVVLQANEDSSYPDTPREVQREVSSFEGAIDNLDKLGLVDPNRVGIIGFSRTCIFVKYALTHSKYSFAAAVAADGTDAGYLQYIAFANSNGSWSTFEGLNGAPPFGEGLYSWLKNSPSFNLDKVHSPLLIQAIGPGSLLAEWEWFAGLTRLKRPVDMIYIPEGVHILERPWDRRVSQQVTVDWFCFWLKDEEDPDSAKNEQYRSWRSLRNLAGRNDLVPGAR
jgi:hypothetical protein